MVSFSEAAYLAVGFVVFVVSLGVGASVLYGVQDSQYNLNVAGCTLALARAGQVNCTTVASNASGSGLTGVLNFSQQSGVIGTILGAVIIIGLLLGAVMISRKE